MRLLSLGFALPDPQIDNHSFLNAPCFFDYDAIVVDPSALSSAIEAVVMQTGELLTADDLPVVNGPGGPAEVSLGEALRDRLSETERLLSRGGVVVVLGYPNVSHPQVSGFGGADRYFWLPAPEGLSWGHPHLVRGAGQGAVLADQLHPFGDYVDRYRSKIAYRAYFGEGAPLGKGANIFARSYGGAAIGVEMALGAGRIVFLPPIDSFSLGAERRELAACLIGCARRMLDSPAHEEPPLWVAERSLPSLGERESELAEAERKLAEAEAGVAEASASAEALARFRLLLWQQGRYALEPIVYEALRLLGFEVRGAPDYPAVLIADGVELFVEVEGAEGPIDMTPHYRLRERRERALDQRGSLPLGLLVVNGERRSRPEDRAGQYVEAVRIASESMGYGVLTTTQLFELARQALGGADEPWRAAARRRLIEARGAVDTDIAAPPATPATEEIPSRQTAH